MYYNDKTIIYYDGGYVKAAETKTDLYCQSLHYGYAVFEGIRAYQTENGVRIFKAKEHYERLVRSCELMSIPFNYTVDELTSITYHVLEQNGYADVYIRPLVICGQGMSLIKPKTSHLMIAAFEWGSYLGQELLNLKISPFCRPHPKSVKVDAKASGHYVNSILATAEAKDEGFDEALLLDHEGFLAEGPGANLFFEKDGRLFTPQPGHILAGITRQTVFEICKELGIEYKEGKFLPVDLYHADSAFYCGTGAEVVGIASVNGKKFNMAWNQSLGKQIQHAYKCLVREQSLQSALSLT